MGERLGSPGLARAGGRHRRTAQLPVWTHHLRSFAFICGLFPDFGQADGAGAGSPAAGVGAAPVAD
jgi:hypothetical protein